MEKYIIEFGSPQWRGNWEIINDGVMGGASSGRIFITEEKTLIFEGDVSLENNGGFTSFRSRAGDFDLGRFSGLMVRVKGDGKNYRLRLRTDDSYEGIAYQAHFSTEPGVWTLVRLPFEAFNPVFRGKVVSNAPPLDINSVLKIGFMIADRQAGPFRLELDWVKAYS